MKKLPLGIYSFEFIRQNDYLYVDKTEFIYRLVDEGMFYFLARPRRFGKSLLITTLLNLFAGRRPLFEGLWITAHGDWSWQPHPVLLLDFNGIPTHTTEALHAGLSSRLQQIATEYGVRFQSNSLQFQLQELILGLYRNTGMPVAVLVDEYDKPIIDHVGQGEAALAIAKSNRNLLKRFYGVLKDTTIASALRFVFLTGVSKFSKVSVFSELNNLYDISMSRHYATLLGYTETELARDFQPYIQRMAAELTWSPEQVMTTMQQYYNGYRFSARDVAVYNPFSVLSAFQDLAIQNYWFQTGTPTFLIHVLQASNYPLPTIEELELDHASFNSFQLNHLPPEVLLFQTGYLTIKAVQGELYRLGYPNQEVKTSFTKSLLFHLMQPHDRTTTD